MQFVVQLQLKMLRLLFLLSIGVLGCQAECNACSNITNVACITDREFQFCKNNQLQQPVNRCPEGYFCTGRTGICDQDETNAACRDCNKCNANKVFACLTARSYALCLGTDMPDNRTMGTCASDQVCDIHNSNICSDPNTGAQASCPANGDVVPNVDEFCRVNQRGGRFQYGTNVNSTCKQYIYCYVSNNIWYGNVYNCPGQTYFNSSSNICQVDPPSSCTGRVNDLLLLNLQLLGRLLPQQEQLEAV